MFICSDEIYQIFIILRVNYKELCDFPKSFTELVANKTFLKWWNNINWHILNVVCLYPAKFYVCLFFPEIFTKTVRVSHLSFPFLEDTTKLQREFKQLTHSNTEWVAALEFKPLLTHSQTLHFYHCATKSIISTFWKLSIVFGEKQNWV